MTGSRSLLGAAVLVGLILMQGCALTGGQAGKRATNIEVRLLSQSCFNGDVVPCG